MWRVYYGWTARHAKGIKRMLKHLIHMSKGANTLHGLRLRLGALLGPCKHIFLSFSDLEGDKESIKWKRC